MKTVDLVLPDLRLQLTTDRGVFARDRIDAGTKLLLLDGPTADEPVGDRAGGDQAGGDLAGPVIVDVGAGYGPIACALATRHPTATVWAVEVNSRARELCGRNAAEAGLTNVVVAEPEEVPDGLVIDQIWSNPPIRVGKQALHELLTTWLERLAPSGSAHIVVQRHLGADSLQQWLIDQGWVVVRRSSKKAYRLFDIHRQPVGGAGE